VPDEEVPVGKDIDDAGGDWFVPADVSLISEVLCACESPCSPLTGDSGDRRRRLLLDLFPDTRFGIERG
jgi:hypothetical protein